MLGSEKYADSNRENVTPCKNNECINYSRFVVGENCAITATGIFEQYR